MSLMEKRIAVIDRQIEWANADIGRAESKLKRLQEKKRLMQTLLELCPSCKGTGEESYMDAAGSRDWRDCKTCGGIGKVGPKHDVIIDDDDD